MGVDGNHRKDSASREGRNRERALGSLIELNKPSAQSEVKEIQGAGSTLTLDPVALTPAPPHTHTLACTHTGLANLLTETHSPMAARAGPRLTNQALAGVADMQVVAGLRQPPCTHFTAATAIQHQGYPLWALGWCPRTATGCPAQLGKHLRRQKPHSVLISGKRWRLLQLVTSDSVGSLAWPRRQADWSSA